MVPHLVILARQLATTPLVTVTEPAQIATVPPKDTLAIVSRNATRTRASRPDHHTNGSLSPRSHFRVCGPVSSGDEGMFILL